MKWVYNDGGREAAGFSGPTGDCVTRSVAIAAELPYTLVYDRLAEGNATERQTRRSRSHRNAGKRTASHGIRTRRLWFKRYMAELGFVWVPTMSIGSGCKVHLAEGELPMGRIIARVSKHYVAVIDGVINDTFDCSRGETRCVYGYWTLKK